MSAFTALNVEPDTDSDEEVDDIKEIQIEEALKLYQTALKFHSQGPEYFAQAEDAYLALFDSEIFKYPEAVTELARDDATLEHVSAPALQEFAGANGVDETSSSLEQVLYLSWKNYGHFRVDVLKYEHDTGRLYENGSQNARVRMDLAALTAVDFFSRALERDDTDLELWRKTARLAGFLESRRLARLCLEGVLDADEESAEDSYAFFGLDEGFALQELKRTYDVLQDDLSTSQLPPGQTRKKLPKAYSSKGDPYPFLSQLVTAPRVEALGSNALGFSARELSIAPPVSDWTAVGQMLLQHLTLEQQGSFDPGPGAVVTVDLPGGIVDHARELPNEQGSTGNLASVTSTAEAVPAQDKPQQVNFDNSVLQPRQDAAGNQQDDFASPEIASKHRADAQQTDLVTEQLQDKTQEQLVSPQAHNMTLPTRKRSIESVGHDETLEGGRGRSKRIRARESLVDATAGASGDALGPTRQLVTELQDYHFADNWRFGIVNALLANIGLPEIGSTDEIQGATTPENQGELSNASQDPSSIDAALIQSFHSGMIHWNDVSGNAFLRQGSMNGVLGDEPGAGLKLYLQHSNTNANDLRRDLPLCTDQMLGAFAQETHEKPLHVNEVALKFLESLLVKSLLEADSSGDATSFDFASGTPYTQNLWPQGLKATVVHVLNTADDFIFDQIQRILSAMEERILDICPNGGPFTLTLEDRRNVTLAQTFFELQLDIFQQINIPSSTVDAETRVLQRDRLHRWATLADGFMKVYLSDENIDPLKDDLALRALWSSTFLISMAEDNTREHVLLCFEELKTLMQEIGRPPIFLPNNACMPEISSTAIDLEISKLNTMDFFLGIFSIDQQEPVSTIENLEPILDPPDDPSNGEGEAFPPESPGSAQPGNASFVSNASRSSGPHAELISFLENGNVSLRLFLWRRLRDAYEAIDYSPKIVYCLFKSIEVILNEMRSKVASRQNNQQEQLDMLEWVKCLTDLVAQAWKRISTDPQPFECMDENLLRSALYNIARLVKLLHAFTLHDDLVRIGHVQNHEAKSKYANETYHLFAQSLRDFNTRLWCLLYYLFKESTVQFKELHKEPVADLIEFLRALHYATGLRFQCHTNNKALPHMIVNELLNNLEADENCHFDLAQALYDIFGVKLLTVSSGLQDHQTTPEALSKKIALKLVDFVMAQIQRIPLKDLLKSDLRSAIEKMQQVIGPMRDSLATNLNKRVITAFLKSPIRPVDLFRSLRGVGDLSTLPTRGGSSKLVSKGWYFLLGQLDLTKFKSQKRTSPGSTDDLDTATAFFKQDLYHSIEKWETWYRLAQAYDTKIDESVLWSADKLNSSPDEIVQLQRNAINCYTMATATAARCEDDETAAAGTLSDLYADFGGRIFASSREPFSMGAFNLDDFSRHYSSNENRMYTAGPFKPLEEYSAWTLASILFKKAIEGKPRHWM